jgi:hypothetical protein
MTAGTGHELVHLAAAVPAHLDFERVFLRQVGKDICVFTHLVGRLRGMSSVGGGFASTPGESCATTLVLNQRTRNRNG